MKNRTFYFGDNLEILRKKITDESFDLIYLDPPFNSNRNYNVFLKEEVQNSPAQNLVKNYYKEAKASELGGGGLIRDGLGL